MVRQAKQSFETEIIDIFISLYGWLVIGHFKDQLAILSLNHCSFDPLAFIKCFKAIFKCTNLHTLGLNTLEVEGHAITLLNQMITNRKVQVVDESGIPKKDQPTLENKDWAIDTRFFENIHTLNLKANAIGNEYLIYIAQTKEILPNFPNLVSLDLFGNSLGMKGEK